MPILAQTIEDKLRADLDAEGSDRYTFDQDFKPAINGAMDILVTIFNNAFADKKLSPEALREITKVKIWQANQYSRISMSKTDIGHSVWTIVAVYPKVKTNKGVSSSPTADKAESKFRGDLSYVSSDQSAKRLTLEEWNENKKNLFMPGNELLKGGLAEYAYCDFADYSSTSYTGNKDKFEIQVRPDIPGELVAIAYLKKPNQVSLVTDSIEFPESLTELISELALSKIAIKQGDGTSLAQIINQYSMRLVSLMK